VPRQYVVVLFGVSRRYDVVNGVVVSQRPVHRPWVWPRLGSR
jgi:hypothetical protein